MLRWLVLLRWLAAGGQLIALTAAGLLNVDLPWRRLGLIIAVTVLTNIGLMLMLRRGSAGAGRSGSWLSAGVILLDVGLLTSLLWYTGGKSNPFVLLFVLHVALAASTLSLRWTWLIIGVVSLCYTLLALLEPSNAVDLEGLPGVPLPVGEAVALLLVLVLVGYFVNRVVSALGERDEQLRLVRERAQVGERLAALTTLAAGAAHELGTPLATIAVVSKEMELAAKRLGDADLADDAALVRQQVDRCRGILEHLRGDVAGRGTDEPGTSDPSRVVAGVREALAADRRERLDVVEAQTPEAKVPARALHQAVELLVNNAFDADDGTGRVEVRLEAVGGNVTIVVADEGPGMDEETCRRATEPFFTTKDPGRGMGLGLFLVRLVAEHNGGTFTLDSDLGVGTTATLVVPVA